MTQRIAIFLAKGSAAHMSGHFCPSQRPRMELPPPKHPNDADGREPRLCHLWAAAALNHRRSSSDYHRCCGEPVSDGGWWLSATRCCNLVQGISTGARAIWSCEIFLSLITCIAFFYFISKRNKTKKKNKILEVVGFMVYAHHHMLFQ